MIPYEIGFWIHHVVVHPPDVLIRSIAVFGVAGHSTELSAEETIVACRDCIDVGLVGGVEDLLILGRVSAISPVCDISRAHTRL